MVSSTGTNFFQKIGDRLPTRDAKSRRGRGIPSGQCQRGHSLAPEAHKQNPLILQRNEDFPMPAKNQKVPHSKNK